MNIIKGLWTGVKAVFGIGTKDGADRVMEVARGVGTWIDEQNFTDEERAKFMLETANVYSKFLASTADENTERSRTRRDIALWIIRVEVFFLIFSLATYPWFQNWSEYAFKIATHDPMSYLVLGIGAFFFGAHIVRTVKQ